MTLLRFYLDEFFTEHMLTFWSQVVSNLKKNDLEARAYLKESREFSKWAANDREKRLTPLTKEQQAQLHNYLLLIAEREKDIYPYEAASLRKRVEEGSRIP